jgi:hypothetical protein
VFKVTLATTTHAPPRVVTILTPLNNWVDIPGSYVDRNWVFALDETELWDKPSYFKFLLDGRFWMNDPYIRITPAADATYNFDESEVTFTVSTPPPPATASTPTPVQPVPPVLPSTAPIVTPTPAPTGLPVSEGSIVNRVVLLAAPLLTVAAAWIAGLVARHVPGIKLDQTQIVSFMIAIVALCLTGAWKWLQGWQQHELLVAQRLAAPLKPVIGVPPVQQL